jgi:hypothetical protein
MNDDDLKQQLREVPDGKRVGSEPDSEAEHFMTCGACGQAFDMRRLDEVFHHEQPGHAPMERH